MTILRPHKSGKSGTGTCLIGTHVDDSIDRYLRLYSLAYDTSKADIIRNLIIDWKEQLEKNYTRQVLSESLAREAIESWKNRFGHVTLERYMSDLETLFKDKIVPEDILVILKLVKDGAGK